MVDLFAGVLGTFGTEVTKHNSTSLIYISLEGIWNLQQNWQLVKQTDIIPILHHLYLYTLNYTIANTAKISTKVVQQIVCTLNL